MNLNHDLEKTTCRMAIEDAIVTAAVALVSSLIAVGGTPSMAVLYATVLPSLLVGIVTYAKKRGIAMTALREDALYDGGGHV